MENIHTVDNCVIIFSTQVSNINEAIFSSKVIFSNITFQTENFLQPLINDVYPTYKFTEAFL